MEIRSKSEGIKGMDKVRNLGFWIFFFFACAAGMRRGAPTGQWAMILSEGSARNEQKKNGGQRPIRSPFTGIQVRSLIAAISAFC